LSVAAGFVTSHAYTQESKRMEGRVMSEKHVRRFARVRKCVVAIVAFAAPIAMLGSAPSALAAEHHPTGNFAVFKDCPLGNSATESCIYAVTESGEFIVGKKTVPIKNPITLQGGVHETAEGKEEFIGAENGETLSKSPQSVPGGLFGLVNCYEITNKEEREACEAIFENKVTGVFATTELAAPASDIGINVENLIEEKGTALNLPVKVHLENPLFGSSCYVGSNSKPIELPLTTGETSPKEPNKPIHGSKGEFEVKEGPVIVLKNNELVNNEFAAPAAEGCGGAFSGIVDKLVDEKLGIPAAAGHNTAKLKGTLETASAAKVKESE
jgi:hypothetical protein